LHKKVFGIYGDFISGVRFPSNVQLSLYAETIPRMRKRFRCAKTYGPLVLPRLCRAGAAGKGDNFVLLFYCPTRF